MRFVRGKEGEGGEAGREFQLMNACQEQGVGRGGGRGGRVAMEERARKRLTVAAKSINSLRAFMRFPPPLAMPQALGPGCVALSIVLLSLAVGAAPVAPLAQAKLLVVRGEGSQWCQRRYGTECLS